MGRVAVDGALQWPSYEGAWTMRAGTGCIVKETVTKVARSVEQALGVWEGGKNRDGEGGVGHNMSQVENFRIVRRTVWRTCFQRIRFSGLTKFSSRFSDFKISENRVRTGLNRTSTYEFTNFFGL